MPSPTGPFINAAFFCERVIEDKEGVLSAIRILDRIINTVIGVDVPTAMPPANFNGTLVVTLKSGSARGRIDVGIVVERPDGMRTPLAESLSAFLEGDDRGVNLVLNLAITLTQEGLYWFDIQLAGELATRVPLRVVYQRQQVAGQGPTPPGAGGSSGPSSL